ncbi:MAG: hypothetical protein JNL49_05750 [Bacteroidia bacterium]|nr:hypothetical protein [Bacteroidia bacterium]
MDETEIIKFSKKFNIPASDSYELDTAFIKYLFSIDTSGILIKNHYQPLQALYYDNNGALKSFHVNCYTGGFPNLNWEQNGAFKTFLPGQQAPLDSVVPLELHLKYLISLSTSEKIIPEKYDYIVVVHWSRFMGRQSKRLIRIVQENAKLSTSKKIRIIYANNDNLMLRARSLSK